MIAALKSALFAAGVVLVGSLDYDPHVLTLRYADRSSERLAATSGDTCNAAVRAIWSGLWRVDPMPTEASCQVGNIFPAGSDKIAGYRQ